LTKIKALIIKVFSDKVFILLLKIIFSLLSLLRNFICLTIFSMDSISVVKTTHCYTNNPFHKMLRVT